jgi:hypothetical protein
MTKTAIYKRIPIRWYISMFFLLLMLVKCVTNTYAAGPVPTWYNVYFFDCNDIALEVAPISAPPWYDPNTVEVAVHIANPDGTYQTQRLTQFSLEFPGDNFVTWEGWNDITVNGTYTIWAVSFITDTAWETYPVNVQTHCTYTTYTVWLPWTPVSNQP